MGDESDALTDWGWDEIIDLEEQEDQLENDLWKMKNGVLISPVDMKISHINNTIRMIERSKKVYQEEGTWYIKKHWLKVFRRELKNRKK